MDYTQHISSGTLKQDTQMGSVLTFLPVASNATVNPAYLTQFLDYDFSLYKQILKMETSMYGSPNVIKQLSPTRPGLTTNTKNEMMKVTTNISGDPSLMLAIKLTQKTDLAIIDLDCDDWPDKKKGAYDLILDLFLRNGAAIRIPVPLWLRHLAGFILSLKNRQISNYLHNVMFY